MHDPAGPAGDAAAPGSEERAPAGCQVHGCKVQLEVMGSYHKRARVCEEHAKAPSVLGADGNELRFCQQCCKLEPLSMFEGKQRACMAAQAKRRERRPAMCHGSKRAKLSAFANAQRGSPNAAGGGGGSAAGSREQPPASPQGRAVAERAAGPTAGAGLALPPIQPVAPAAGAHAAVAAAAQAAVGAAAQDVAPVQQQGGGQAEQLLAYLLGRGPAPHLPSLRELLAQYPVALPPEPVQPSAGMAAAAPLAVPLPLPLLAPPLHIARPYSTMLGVDLGALCELLEDFDDMLWNEMLRQLAPRAAIPAQPADSGASTGDRFSASNNR